MTFFSLLVHFFKNFLFPIIGQLGLTSFNTIVAERQGWGKGALSHHSFANDKSIRSLQFFLVSAMRPRNTQVSFPAGNYMFKVNNIETLEQVSNKDNRTMPARLFCLTRIRPTFPFYIPWNIKSALVFWCFLMFSFFTNLVFFSYFFSVFILLYLFSFFFFAWYFLNWW